MYNNIYTNVPSSHKNTCNTDMDTSEFAELNAQTYINETNPKAFTRIHIQLHAHKHMHTSIKEKETVGSKQARWKNVVMLNISAPAAVAAFIHTFSAIVSHHSAISLYDWRFYSAIQAHELNSNT